MPNAYNSEFTGEHNDEYDDRIAALTNRIVILEENDDEYDNRILALTNRITILENLLNITLISPVQGSNNVSIAGAGAVCYQMGKLVILNLNFQIINGLASGAVIMSGLPPARHKASGSAVQTSANTIRLFVTEDGQLTCDGAISTTGWYDGSIVYIAT